MIENIYSFWELFVILIFIILLTSLIKNLFDGDTNTYDKVLSQIVTFESWAEVSTFLETQVKIEYNDWNDKEEIAKRFSTILKKHFDF